MFRKKFLRRSHVDVCLIYLGIPLIEAKTALSSFETHRSELAVPSNFDIVRKSVAATREIYVFLAVFVMRVTVVAAAKSIQMGEMLLTRFSFQF